jgi:hypothetical protein
MIMDLYVLCVEKEVASDGTVTIKERTLRNPTKEELETKTLDELMTDEGDDVTTIKSFKIKLNDNDLSDHAFSNFGLENPNDSKPSETSDSRTSGVIGDYFWFTVKMTAIIGVGFITFAGYKSFLKSSNSKSKRRYNANNLNEDDDSDENDEEELRNIRNAVRRGGSNAWKPSNNDDLLKEDECDDEKF